MYMKNIEQIPQVRPVILYDDTPYYHWGSESPIEEQATILAGFRGYTEGGFTLIKFSGLVGDEVKRAPDYGYSTSNSEVYKQFVSDTIANYLEEGGAPITDIVAQTYLRESPILDEDPRLEHVVWWKLKVASYPFYHGSTDSLTYAGGGPAHKAKPIIVDSQGSDIQGGFNGPIEIYLFDSDPMVSVREEYDYKAGRSLGGEKRQMDLSELPTFTEALPQFSFIRAVRESNQRIEDQAYKEFVESMAW